MFKRTCNTIVKEVTPKEAEAFLAMNNFPGQRDLNQIKARQYADMMENGTMRPVDIAVLTMPSGVKYLANGQHVCTAIILYGKQFPARIDFYKCDTDRDAWILFGSFDVHASRTEKHIIKAARGLFTNDKLHTIPLRTLSSLGAAMFYIEAGDGSRPDFRAKVPAKTCKADAIDRNSKELLEASFVIGPETSGSPLTRVGVATAIVMTNRANFSKSQVFWEQVRTGESLKRNDPAYKLREWLRTPSISATKNSGGTGGHVSQYAASVAFWNSFITGEHRTCVKVRAMKDLPEVLG